MIHWSENQDSFIIEDMIGFAKILPDFFSTRNVSSFVRQLNLYGFKKSKCSKHVTEFRHKFFKRGHFSDIFKIKKVVKKSQQKNIREEFDELKKEYNLLKNDYNGLRRDVKKLTGRNKMLFTYNNELFRSLTEERADFKRDLKNLLMLFFNSLKQKSEEAVSMVRDLLFRTKVLTQKEKMLLVESREFKGLIPLITKKIVEDKDTRNSFIGKLVDLFEFEDKEDKQTKKILLDFYRKRLLKNQRDIDDCLKEKRNGMERNSGRSLRSLNAGRWKKAREDNLNEFSVEEKGEKERSNLTTKSGCSKKNRRSKRIKKGNKNSIQSF